MVTSKFVDTIIINEMKLSNMLKIVLMILKLLIWTSEMKIYRNFSN